MKSSSSVGGGGGRKSCGSIRGDLISRQAIGGLHENGIENNCKLKLSTACHEAVRGEGWVFQTKMKALVRTHIGRMVVYGLRFQNQIHRVNHGMSCVRKREC